MLILCDRLDDAEVDVGKRHGPLISGPQLRDYRYALIWMLWDFVLARSIRNHVTLKTV